ncbi:MAG: hypothetical protein HQL06_10155 [Nitrospirae bacterium]|nr:hypothetical protein [Nitrospirota bacterium]
MGLTNITFDADCKDGALHNFIRDKLKTHSEPTKKDTPRGEPLLYKKKLSAALLMLTNLNGREISELTGAAYISFREWKGQRRFKALVEQLNTEYAEQFVLDMMDGLRGEFNIKSFAPINGLVISLPLTLGTASQAEFRHYSDQLKKLILKTFNDQLIALDDKEFAVWCRMVGYTFIGNFLGVSDDDMRVALADELNRISIMTAKFMRAAVDEGYKKVEMELWEAEDIKRTTGFVNMYLRKAVFNEPERA